MSALVSVLSPLQRQRGAWVSEDRGGGHRGDQRAPATPAAPRSELAADPGHLLDVLVAGNAVANDLAENTLRQVRRLMRMDYRPAA
jgi:tryptophanyl-tRNA synthetase